jgi:hypothetical protein
MENIKIYLEFSHKKISKLLKNQAYIATRK